MALLALSFAAALVARPVVARFGLRTRPVTAPLAVAVLAAACVAGALALQGGAANDVTGSKPAGEQGDAYYPK